MGRIKKGSKSLFEQILNAFGITEGYIHYRNLTEKGLLSSVQILRA